MRVGAELPFHEIADVFPLLPDERLRSLGESIAESGLRHPIWIFEDRILDGRNRYRAMRLAGLPFEESSFKEFDGDWDEAVKFVADENLERRDLTIPERSFCAARLSDMRHGRPTTKEKARRRAFSEADLAAKFNVGETSLQAAKKVLKDGAPELVEAVQKGEVGLKPARELAKLPAPEQKKAVAGGREAVKKAVAEVKKTRPKHELSPVQKAVRGAAKGSNLMADLMSAVIEVKTLTAKLGEEGALFTPEQRATGIEMADQLVNAGEWLRTIFGAGRGVSDAALQTLIDGGNAQ